MIKVPVGELERWDAEHDDAGRLLSQQDEKRSSKEGEYDRIADDNVIEIEKSVV